MLKNRGENGGLLKITMLSELKHGPLLLSFGRKSSKNSSLVRLLQSLQLNPIIPNRVSSPNNPHPRSLQLNINPLKLLSNFQPRVIVHYKLIMVPLV